MCFFSIDPSAEWHLPNDPFHTSCTLSFNSRRLWNGPLRHYATAPLRHYTITPLCHYAIMPLRHYAITLLHNYAITPLHHYATAPLRHGAITPLCASQVICHYTITLLHYYAITLLHHYAITPLRYYALWMNVEQCLGMSIVFLLWGAWSIKWWTVCAVGRWEKGGGKGRTLHATFSDRPAGARRLDFRRFLIDVATD